MKRTSLGQGTIYLTISTITFVVSAYLINIILGRYLGPSSYGIYGVIITLMTAINLTQTSGLPLAVAKFIAEDESHADGVLKSGLIVQIISTVGVSVLVFLFAHPLAGLLKDASLTAYIQLSAAIFPLYGIYAIYANYYNGLHYFRKQALINIVYAVAKFVTIITFVYFFKVYGAILAFIISPVIALLFGFHLPQKVQQFPYKKLILFALPLIGSAIFGTLLQSIDLFFIKALVQSNRETGYYTANQNIAEIPFYGITALASVLFPGISRSIRHESSEATRNLIQKSLRFCLLIITPSVLLISATSSEILTFLYSNAYHAGSASLAILAFGAGFFTIFTILSTIMSAAGSPVKLALLTGSGVVISAISCFLLIPRFAIQGAAIATTIAAGTIMIIAAVMVYRKFHMLVSSLSMLRIGFSSLVIYLLARSLPATLVWLPFFYLFLFALYFLLLVICKEFTKDDLQLVTSFLPKWASKKITI